MFVFHFGFWPSFFNFITHVHVFYTQHFPGRSENRRLPQTTADPPTFSCFGHYSSATFLVGFHA